MPAASSNVNPSRGKGWLSKSIDSIGTRRRRMVGGAWRWRWRLLLTKETVRRALALVAALTALAALTAWLLAPHSCPSAASTDLLNNRLSRIGTVAQVIGGIYAVMLAVITFGVDQLGAKEGWRAALVAWRIRSFWPLTISAVGLAATATGTLVAPLHDLGVSLNMQVLLGFVLFYAAVSMALSLMILAQVIRSSSGSDQKVREQELLRVLLSEALATDDYFLDLEKAVNDRAATTDVRMASAFERSIMPSEERTTSFPLKRGGLVVDVHAGRLDALSDTVKAIAPGWQLRLPFYIGDSGTADWQAKLSLSKQVEQIDFPPKPGSLPPISLTPDQRDRLTRDSNAVVRFGRRNSQPAAELNDLLNRVAEGVESDIHHRQLAPIKQALEWMLDFVQMWTGMAPHGQASVRPRWLASRNLLFSGPFGADWYEVARRAAISNDNEVAEAIDSFFDEVQRLAFRERHFILYDHITTLRMYFVLKARGNKSMSAAALALSDAGVKRLLNSTRYAAEKADTDAASLMPFYDRTMAWLLTLIREAVEQGDGTNTRYLVGRLIGKYEGTQRRRVVTARTPVVDSPEALNDYGMLVVVGWMIHLLEKGTTEQKEIAASVISKIAPALPSPDLAVIVWELYHADSAWEPAVHRRLGGLDWEFDEVYDPRASSHTTRAGGRSWTMDGLLFALLQKWHLPPRQRASLFQSYPPPAYWRSDQAKARGQDVLNVLPAALQPQKPLDSLNALETLVDFRQLGHEKAKRLRELRASVDPANTQPLIDLVRADIANSPPPSPLLQRLAGHSPFATAVDRYRPYGGLLALRDWLLDTPEQQRSQFSSVVDSMLIADRDRSLCSLASVLATEELNPLTAVPAHAFVDEVRAARAKLIAAGHAPDLLVIPDDDWAVKSLFGMVKYQLPTANEDDEVIGQWEGLNVAVWPGKYNAAVICDTAATMGPVADRDASLDVGVVDDDAAKLALIIQQTEAAARTVDLPPHDHTPRIRLYARRCPSFGVRNPAAAIRIPVDLKASVVYLPNERFVHRLDCPYPDWEEPTEVKAVNSASDGSLCPHCFPADDGDDEPA